MIRTLVFILSVGLAFTPLRAASTEQQVKFPATGDVSLAGTLQLPAGDAACPAVVLIAGSGPTDRDGNQPPALVSDLLKTIAVALADDGIASLRYDKRGMYANKADLPKDKAQFGDFFSWENFVGDAAAACRFLREQPRIDPRRVGILGHSEGGMLALEAAHILKSEGKAPAVLILLSTPGRTIDLVIADQLKALMIRQHVTPAQTKYFLDENDRITKAIRETGEVPEGVPPGLAALYPKYLGKFLHSELASDPCKLAADFSGPVLIVAGAADIQVSPELDAKALAAALATRQGDVHKLVMIPKASHNLKIVAKPEEPGFKGPVAPEALVQLRKWTSEQLRAKR